MTLLLTPAKARQQLGVSERGFWDLLKKGLPYIKVGKRRMFPANDLATWVSEQARRTNSTNARGRRTGTSRTPSKVIDFTTALERTTKT